MSLVYFLAHDAGSHCWFTFDICTLLVCTGDVLGLFQIIDATHIYLLVLSVILNLCIIGLIDCITLIFERQILLVRQALAFFWLRLLLGSCPSIRNLSRNNLFLYLVLSLTI